MIATRRFRSASAQRLRNPRRLQIEPLEYRLVMSGVPAATALTLAADPATEYVPMLVAPPTPSTATLAATTQANVAGSQASVTAQQMTDETAAGAAINAFAKDLYAVLQKQAPGNLAFSPLSISTALAMTLAGAGGQTASQIANALHVAQDPATVQQDFGALLSDLNSAGQAGGFDLSVANAIWAQAGFPLNDQFLNAIQSNYGGGLNDVDFAQNAETARQTINDWVAGQTHQKIQNLIPAGALTDLTRLVLTNAMYFKGQWAQPFDAQSTSDALFTLASGAQVSTSTMHDTGGYGYMEKDGYQVLDLPYAGDRLSMVLLLPSQDAGASGLDASQLPADLDQWLSGLTQRVVDVSLPKFTMATTFSLADALQSLGMTDAFSSDADFSGITDAASLQIDSVFHQAFISVNELGTEAAAATSVSVTASCVPPDPSTVQFNADHPFEFLIRDDQSGSVLFMGQVMDPKPDGATEVQTTADPSLVVTTARDVVDPNDGLTSLREAIAAANANPGADTIHFDASLKGSTISLSLGELAITDSVTIEGPGAANLTINANGQSRIFNVDDGNDTANINVEIDGLTLTGGSAANGGAIFSTEDLALDSVNITGNTAGNQGGGIFVENTGTTTIQESTISKNSAGIEGGGICLTVNSGSTTIDGSTISGNNAADGGGIYARASSNSQIVIQDSTIYGNSASADGGGIVVLAADGSTTLIQNSTITGNTAQGTGGGLDVQLWTALSYPITSNLGPQTTAEYGPPEIAVRSTILAGNTDTSGTAPDVLAPLYFSQGSDTAYGVVRFNNCLVGDSTGAQLTATLAGEPDSDGNLVGSATAPLDPMLAPLADNGGPTQTCALLAGSPAIDMGSNPANLAYDQRGEDYVRVVGPQIDIGAYEAATSLAVPVVTAIHPLSGPPAGGTTVTIIGRGLAGATKVMFGTVAATIQSNTATQIVVIAPAGTSGAVDVTVTTATGDSATSPADRFTYITPTQPTVGLYDPARSMFLLRNTNDSGFADEVYSYGTPGSGMLPIVGDWDGDGGQSFGLYDPSTSTFYFQNTNSRPDTDGQGCTQIAFFFGPANAGYEPVVGDWNGDGRDSVGLFDPATSTFYLRNTDSLQSADDHGYADIVFSYGAANSGMLPIAGDWDGSGHDGIGLYSQSASTFYLRESTQFQGSSDHGYADIVFNYGVPNSGMLPVAGDWDGSGHDGIGLYSQSTAMFYLRESLQLQGQSDHGYADASFMYGSANGDRLPVFGNWGQRDLPVWSDLQTQTPNDVAANSTESFPTASTSTRLTAPATPSTTFVSDANASSTNDAAATNLQQIQAASGAPLGAAAQLQTQVVDPRALDHIDLSTMTGHVAGLQDLDAVADALVGGTLRGNTAHADAAMAS